MHTYNTDWVTLILNQQTLTAARLGLLGERLSAADCEFVGSGALVSMIHNIPGGGGRGEGDFRRARVSNNRATVLKKRYTKVLLVYYL